VADFEIHDSLFVGCDDEDFVNGELRIENIRFPDFSCNWSRFSIPHDVRFRPNAKATDGCYSFTVATARFHSYANPVHDPIQDPDYENYSHVEIREVFEGEDPLSEPPKKRKKDNRLYRDRRLLYRQNIQNSYRLELPVGAA